MFHGLTEFFRQGKGGVGVGVRGQIKCIWQLWQHKTVSTSPLEMKYNERL